MTEKNEAQLIEELQNEVLRLREKDQRMVRYAYDYLELKLKYKDLQEEKEKMEIELLEKIFCLKQRIKILEGIK